MTNCAGTTGIKNNFKPASYPGLCIQAEYQLCNLSFCRLLLTLF